MDIDTLPDLQTLRTSVKQTLENLKIPANVENSVWFTSCLVAQGISSSGNTITRYDGLFSAFSGCLTTLESQQVDFARVLKARYWDGLTVAEIAINLSVSERNIYYWQSKGIASFTTIIMGMEEACRQSRLPNQMARKNGLTQITHRSMNLKRLVLSVTVFTVLVLGLLIRNSESSQSEVVSSKCKSPAVIAPQDGLQFIRSQGVSTFNTKNLPMNIYGDRIRSLAIDTHGLWIGYFSTQSDAKTGIGFYDKTRWNIYDQLSETFSKNINDIIIDHSGNVWVATEKSGVMMFDGSQWITYNTKNTIEIPSDNTYGLAVDSANHIWLATWEGVAEFDGHEWMTRFSLFTKDTHAIAFDSDGNTWIGHIEHGVDEIKADKTQVSYHPKSSGLGGEEIRDIVVRKTDSQSPESVWFATADNGLSRFEQGQWTVYTCENGLPSNDVRAVAIDKYNRVWAATASGVVYFEHGKWLVYDTIDTVSIAFGLNCQNCIFDNDHIWTGTTTLGLTHSRVPYPDTVDAIQVKTVCFISEQQDRDCKALNYAKGTDVITAEYIKKIIPGEKFNVEFTVVPQSPYELSEQRGDFLSNINEFDDNLFGAHFLIAVKDPNKPDQPISDTPFIVNAGQEFTFEDSNKPLTAPNLPEGQTEASFSSDWRIWTHTRYAGPTIRIIFYVQKP